MSSSTLRRARQTLTRSRSASFSIISSMPSTQFFLRSTEKGRTRACRQVQPVKASPPRLLYQHPFSQALDTPFFGFGREKEKEGTKLWPYGGSISLYNSVIAFCLLPYHALALHDFSLHHRSHVLYPYDRYDMIFSLSALQGSISQFRSSARLTVIDLVSRYNRHFQVKGYVYLPSGIGTVMILSEYPYMCVQ